MADSTINGLTALTGANVDNTADQLAIWDNSDSTTKKITRTELMVGLPAGTAAAPTISFSGDTDTGIWNNAANELSIACNGSTQFRVRTTGIFITPNGTAAAPSVTNLNDSDTGMWWPTTNTLGFSTGGAEAMRIDSAQRLLVGGSANVSIPDGAGASITPKFISQAVSGNAAVCAYVNDGTNNRRIGMFVDQTNGICGISASTGSTSIPFVYRDVSAERLRITTDGLVQIAAAGTAAAPALTIAGNTAMGFYSGQANQLTIATAGSARVSITSTGRLSMVGNGTAASPAFIHSTYTDTGLWWPTTSTLAISTAGTERLRLDANGNVIVNTAAVATTATDGFLYVPSCAGAPTGTPTSYTGRVPIVVDTTNNKLYFYSGGAWRDAGP